MEKDYYKIMGVSRDASEKEIKTAYRKLARKYHPDISKESNAEERFKEMGEAYEVLHDKNKKAEYDQQLKYREFNPHGQQSRQHAGSSNQSYNYGGGQFDGDIFESIFGHSRQQHYQPQPQAGQDYRGKVSISLEEAYKGTVKSIQIPSPNDPDKTQTLNVKVPAGVKSEQQIRLAGQGAPGINGGPRGNIYLTVDVMKHPLFDVIDHDIYLTLPITPWEAALGATVVVPSLAGKIDLKIPEGSQGGQKLRLKEKGLPGKNPGHQYVLLKIITPPAHTEAAKELYQQMAETMPFNPREHLGA